MEQKLKFVLSDLHFGAGYANEGNHLENFVADEAFICLLDEIQQESEQDKREVEFIINGDFLDFLAVPAADVYDPRRSYPKGFYWDSSELASIKRLNLIAAGHGAVFQALAKFVSLRTPQRRVTLIKGDHDVNLYWPGVKARLRELLDSAGGRASQLMFAEKFVNRENIHIRHGHQEAEVFNRYPDFLDPRRTDDRTQLHYPLSFQLYTDFLAETDIERWFMDNVKPATALICYALPLKFDFAVKLLLGFIKIQSGQLPADPFLQALLDTPSRQHVEQHYMASAEFRSEFHEKMLPYLNLPPLVTDFNNPLGMGQAIQEHQQTILRQAAETVAEQVGAQVIIFGHTHRPSQESLNTGAVYINTGSWTKDCITAPGQNLVEFFKGTLQHVIPNSLPYARIDYLEPNNLAVQLLHYALHCLIKSDNEPTGLLEKGFQWLTKWRK